MNLLQCLRWDDASVTWTDSDIETLTPSGSVYNNINYVRCNMTLLAPVALFEGKEMEVTTTGRCMFAIQSQGSN